MLVLSRRPHEGIRIRHDIVVTVLEISGDKVRLGIEAPASVQIHREEIYLAVLKANEEASTTSSAAVAGLAQVIGDRVGGTAPPAAPPAPAPAAPNADGSPAG
ncbi:carbon storage regulator CsrA [Phycicoccus avicenniae]|uniref:carbon storage regulator CsrA n=1 Tax=Phycicoccus avicenniae TaxID=2828860 RepID=UPI003D2A4A7D